MNQLTRRVVLGAAIVGAGALGKTNLGDDPQPPVGNPPQTTSSTGPSVETTTPTPSPTPSPTPTLAQADPGLVAWTNSSTFSMDDAAEGEAFATAHFTLWIEGYRVSEEISAEEAGHFEGNLTAMRAPDGHEFVMAKIKAGVPWNDTDPRSTIGVNVAGKLANRPTPFGAYSPASGSYEKPILGVLAVVKKGGRVALQITDVGVTAVYDLRSGKRGVDGRTKTFDGFLNPLQVTANTTSAAWSRPFRTNAPGVISESDTLLMSADGEFAFRLLPWTKAQGWAPPGNVWLVCDLKPRRYPSRKPQRPLPAYGRVDLSKSYSLTPKGGKASLAKVSTAQVDLKDYLVNYDKHILTVWAVPATAVSATITVDFVISNLHVPYSNGNVGAVFTAPAKPAVIQLTFRP